MIHIVVTAEEVREEMKVTIDRLGRLLAPDARSVKIERGEISKMTGIPARRIKDYAIGAVREPSAHQVRTISNLYRAARALTEEDHNGADGAHNERFISKRHERVPPGATASGISERWKRALGTRSR